MSFRFTWATHSAGWRVTSNRFAASLGRTTSVSLAIGRRGGRRRLSHWHCNSTTAVQRGESPEICMGAVASMLTALLGAGAALALSRPDGGQAGHS